MRKVAQTRFGEPGGNCFQAAVASLFDLRLDDVPDFMNDYGVSINHDDYAWLEALRDWTRKNYDLEVMPVPWEYVEAFDLRPTGVQTGLAGRGNHTVVVVNGEFWHDPGGSGPLTEPLVVYTFVPDASSLIQWVGYRNRRLRPL